MREYANAAISDTKFFSSHSIIGYKNQFKQYGTVFNFPRFLIILRTHFPYFEATYNDEIHPLAKKKKKMVTGDSLQYALKKQMSGKISIMFKLEDQNTFVENYFSPH